MSEKDTNHIMMMLGRMESKIDAAHEKMDNFLKNQEKHSERIGLLEHFKTGLMAKISVIMFVVGGAWAILIKKIGL